MTSPVTVSWKQGLASVCAGEGSYAFAEKIATSLEDDDCDSHICKELSQALNYAKAAQKNTTFVKYHCAVSGKKTYLHLIFKTMPFLADSFSMELVQGVGQVFVTTSTLFGFDGNKINLTDETHTYFLAVIDRALSQEEQQGLQQQMQQIAHDVQKAVEDWPEMLKALRHGRDSLPGIHKEKAVPFLTWVHEDHFTFLGYRCIQNKKVSRALGVVCNDAGPYFGIDPQKEETLLNKSRISTAPFMITKTMVRSKIHRPVPMDVLRLWIYDTHGQIIGEHQFFGLFTAAAYNTSLENIPYISTKVENVMKEMGCVPNSYQERHLLYILNAFPKDVLFQTDERTLQNILNSIGRLKTHHKVTLFFISDPMGHFVSALVYVPQDRYTPMLADHMGETLASCFKGVVVSHKAHMGGDLSYTRVHYIISTDAHPDHHIVCDRHSTEALLDELSLPWPTHYIRLCGGKGIGQNVFSELYQKQYTPEEGVLDAPFIAKALTTKKRVFRVYQDAQQGIHIKIFNPESPLYLSETFPILQNMGLQVQSEVSMFLNPVGDTVWLHHFVGYTVQGNVLLFDRVYQNFLETLDQVFDGDLENDPFNRLVLAGNAAPRHVLLIRTYYAYMRQIGWPHTRATVVPVLEKYPLILRALKNLFYAQFQPESSYSVDEILKDTENLIASVQTAEEEMIFVRMIQLIQSTLSTNFFQKDDEGLFKPYVSIKLDAQKLGDAASRAKYEIFVYAAHVEGIHIRGGAVARGGLRWSDRPSDYRREVMDLMQAQFVKNAVIVPMGAKGGFYVKADMTGLNRDQIQALGIAGYKTFIQGLLDVVDHLDLGADVSFFDAKKDAYLVVAADKGTATFSDIANALSKAYGFWLGDAFASGGSAGYDHKKMGITSRGVWESVKRHFIEGNISMDAPFTVVAVGDMSGDVFGNGMLYSKNIQLVAAFNHKHIFIDPSPNPETSYRERKRLFEAPGSGWHDYNEQHISKGGGIYPRDAKRIVLSTEAQAALQTTQAEWRSNDLIQHILKRPVDLLWFGGIGTYIKGPDETHVDVGDHANDAVRISGTEVRARVIGEGANLAITQKGRIACAQQGTALFRDAIDNAAGVHCSDYEVNLKILFSRAMTAGLLTETDRNILLEKMTHDVADLVLFSNWAQALALYGDFKNQDLKLYEQLLRVLEGHHLVDRERDALPTTEAFQMLIDTKNTLSLPQLSVLFSYIKLYFKEALLKLPLQQLDGAGSVLESYFPFQLKKQYDDLIHTHPLAAHILATEIANLIVNMWGIARTYQLFLCVPSDQLKERVSQFLRLWEQVPLKELWKNMPDDFLRQDLQETLTTFIQKNTAAGGNLFAYNEKNTKDLSAQELINILKAVQ